ncbi:hypothetical protein HDE_12479 [Halotydeus destructor]|nr:hypothetical protein HDE_12479 [Halotydeus destructor]
MDLRDLHHDILSHNLEMADESSFQQRCDKASVSFQFDPKNHPLLQRINLCLGNLNVLHTAILANHCAVVSRVLKMEPATIWCAAKTTGDVTMTPLELAFFLQHRGLYRKGVIWHLLRKILFHPRAIPIAGAGGGSLKKISIGIMNTWSPTGGSILATNLKDQVISRLVVYGVALRSLDSFGKSLGFQLVDAKASTDRFMKLASLGMPLISYLSDGTSLLEYAAKNVCDPALLNNLLAACSPDEVNRSGNSGSSFLHHLVARYSLADIKGLVYDSLDKFRLHQVVYRGLASYLTLRHSPGDLVSIFRAIPMLQSLGYIVDGDDLLAMSKIAPEIVLEILQDDRAPNSQQYAVTILREALVRLISPTAESLILKLRYCLLKWRKPLEDFFEPGEVLGSILRQHIKVSYLQIDTALKHLARLGFVFSREDALMLTSRDHTSVLVELANSQPDIKCVVSEIATEISVVYMLNLLTTPVQLPSASQMIETLRIFGCFAREVWLKPVQVSTINKFVLITCLDNYREFSLMSAFIFVVGNSVMLEDWMSADELQLVLHEFKRQGFKATANEISMALQFGGYRLFETLVVGDGAVQPDALIRCVQLSRMITKEQYLVLLPYVTNHISFETTEDLLTMELILSLIAVSMTFPEENIRKILTDIQSRCNLDYLVRNTVQRLISEHHFHPAARLMCFAPFKQDWDVLKIPKDPQGEFEVFLKFRLVCYSFCVKTTDPDFVRPLALLSACALKRNVSDIEAHLSTLEFPWTLQLVLNEKPETVFKNISVEGVDIPCLFQK